MNIAFFVSAHGFGHAARAAAIMSALRRQEPDCGLDVFSRVPAWFFSEAVNESIRYHNMLTDVGMVQKDPFAVDLQATLAALADFLPFSETMVQEMASGLVACECRAVVCDISPLGIAVAKAAGVPSVLVENFTWDWLYTPYLKTSPALGTYIEMIGAWLSKADVHLQTEPVCRKAVGVTRLHPISRPPKKEAVLTRRDLGVSDSRPLVLITMGGVASRHRVLKYLEDRPGVTFVIPHDVSEASRQGNLITLPHHSVFYHPDLVYAADLVVGKLGYSTLAEVGHAGKPFGYVIRGESAESRVLAEYAGRHMNGRAFTEEEFLSGRWLDAMDTLLVLACRKPAFPNDADRAASIVLNAASDTPSGVRTFAQRFDPFNDRLSRNIRNRLSEAFVSALLQRKIQPVLDEVDAVSDLTDAFVYRDYIKKRLVRYRQILDRISAGQIQDAMQQAIAVWNAELFFECHEYLETLWKLAAGDERKAIQGLIKAAGVFVHRELGRNKPAERLSPKASALLERYRKRLFFIVNLEDLMAALDNSGAGAPKLKGA